ncbi:metallophosphoesterase [Chitinophaga deserti]|uniref:metallophosphoesterase n=1 Tax=Chitinophaga deserti TaxID=2164099 RepID=UPI000D6D5030|nr:metallophosphoesterase [Chitinophaga deserti]
MINRIFTLLLCSFFACAHTAAGHEKPTLPVIRIKVKVPDGQTAPKMKITYTPAFFYSRLEPEKILAIPKGENAATWNLKVDKPMQINITTPDDKYYAWYIHPGDDLQITYQNQALVITGPGSEKYRFRYETVFPLFRQLQSPQAPKSLQGFIEWNTYCDQKAAIVEQSLDKYRKLYPEANWELDFISFLAVVEGDRNRAFQHLCNIKKQLGITHADTRKLYEKKIYNKNLKWLFSQSSWIPVPESYYGMFKSRCLYYHFDQDTASADMKADASSHMLRRMLDDCDSILQPALKDQFMAFLYSDKILRTRKFALAEEVRDKLKHQVTDKSILSELTLEEMKMLRYELIEGRVFGFKLQDADGRFIGLNKEKPEILVLAEADPAGNVSDPLFHAINKEFSGNPHVRLATVTGNVTFETWKSGIKIVPGITPLYAPATNDRTDYMQTFHEAAPGRTWVIAPYKEGYSRDIRSMLPSNVNDTTTAILEAIRENLIQLHDGPYINYAGDTAFIYNLLASRVSIDTLLHRKPGYVQAATHVAGQFFRIPVKAAITPPPSQYRQPGKLLVISDMEGNLPAMARFLIAHGVIDSAYNWTYGTNHLLLNGDFMDRGKQVTECLWLLYKLEDEAIQAGGRVHFLLGNHEIINLYNDVRYVNYKYLHNAKQMHLGYDELLSVQTEMGRWLRSRNMVEKIGSHLFVHGGISPAINNQQLSIDSCNQLSRQFLLFGAHDSAQTAIQKQLHLTEDSPLWYRGYYPGKNKTVRTPIEEINKTLSFYGVQRIITGHTVVPDVSAFYDGKVINADTHHASGDVEGLLIENGQYYRITADGKQHTLPVQY